MQVDDVLPAQLAFAPLVTPVTIPAENWCQPISKQIHSSSHTSAAVLGAVTAQQALVPNPHGQGCGTATGQRRRRAVVPRPSAGSRDVRLVPAYSSPSAAPAPWKCQAPFPCFSPDFPLPWLFAGGRNLAPDAQDLKSSLLDQCQIFRAAFQQLLFLLQ